MLRNNPVLIPDLLENNIVLMIVSMIPYLCSCYLLIKQLSKALHNLGRHVIIELLRPYGNSITLKCTFPKKENWDRKSQQSPTKKCEIQYETTTKSDVKIEIERQVDEIDWKNVQM